MEMKTAGLTIQLVRPAAFFSLSLQALG